MKSFSINDWELAFRKAKVDLFYSTFCDKEAILAFEKDLDKNLGQIKSAVEQGDIDSFDVGSYFFSAKGYDKDENEYKYRLMANLPVAFHVVSSMWVAKCGSEFEKRMPAFLYANRLRRTGVSNADYSESGNNQERFEVGEINEEALGNFQPYVYAYRKWRQDAINAIDAQTAQDKSSSVICLDVKDYYYSIDPSFLSGDGVIPEDLISFHEFFLELIQKWMVNSAKELGVVSVGIPVGLSASNIFANLALQPFDEAVRRKLLPEYYGRYVDDIIIVLGEISQVSSIDCLYDIVGAKVKNKTTSGLLCLEEKNNDREVHFECNCSDFLINERKSSFFEFKDKKDIARLDILKRQIAERSSEWRALPNLPYPSDMDYAFLRILDDDNELSQHLKNLKGFGVQPSRFCFCLRDCESITRTLAPNDWKDVREAFLNACTRYIFEKTNILSFEKFIPRVLSLGALCLDFDCVNDLLDSIKNSLTSILNSDKALYSSCNGIEGKKVCENHKEFIQKCVRQSLLLANPCFDSKKLSKDNQQYWKLDKKQIFNFKDYFWYDLAMIPLKSLMIGKETSTLALYPFGSVFFKENTFACNIISFWKEIINNKSEEGVVGKDANACELKKRIKNSTRPLSTYDFYYCLLNEKDVGGKDLPTLDFELMQSLLSFFRGYGKAKGENKIRCNENQYFIPSKQMNKDSVNVAVTSISMEEKKLERLLNNLPSNTIGARYRQFSDLINSIIHCNKHIDYVVFPELALPARWFIQAANKLQRAGINLISGVEYIENDLKGRVSNEVWASLSHSCFPYRSYLLLRQAKLIPTYDEVDLLRSNSKKSWYPDLNAIKDKANWPIVIRHGEFFFAILVCSELMDIRYRNNLRGEIDCLFVPEWNKDVDTFNDLVNSSASDLHAFIVQCNNNKYGDNRIRAPYKESFRRDIVKLKGGLNSYFVVGKIEHEELRLFQSSLIPDRSMDALFKPYPSGYEMSEERRESLERLIKRDT